MIQLQIKNSISTISGLSIQQHKALKQVLSYKIDSQQAYFSGSWKNRRYLLGNTGNFPTGLLYLVEGFCEKEGIRVEVEDLRVRPRGESNKFTATFPFDPYKEQFEAAHACLNEDRGIVSAPTGTGKSLIVAMIVNLLQVRTLIVVPSLELKRQITESLQDIFKSQKVGSFSDNADIAVDNVDALDPKIEAKYDCVIIDEFHHSGAKTYRELNKKSWRGVFYRFGITATPFRSNENERLLLESVLSKVIYRLDYSTAVEQGYIVPIEPYLIQVPTTPTNAYTYAEAYSELIINKSQRNQLLVELVTRLYNAKQSTLVLVDQIKHGEEIQQSLASIGVHVPFANGQDEDSRRMILEFNQQKYPVLIGSSILGEGVDTKPCEWVILAGGTGKSRGKLMQACGRAVRKFPGKESAKIITFYDASHKFFKKHHAAFVKTMREEYGVKPVNLPIDLL